MTWKPAFASVVMQRADAQFTTTLRAWGVELRDDQLFIGDRLAALCRFEELGARNGKLAEWCAAGARPFVGAPVKLFTWTHAPLSIHDIDEHAALVRGIAHASLGAVLSVDEDELRELVVQRTFRLSELTQEYGFDEGDALLESAAGPYIDDVLAQVRAALAREQLDIWVGLDTDGPGPNPLRAWPPMTRAGADVPNEDVDRVLAKLEIEIWAFRERLYDSRDTFWYE